MAIYEEHYDIKTEDSFTVSVEVAGKVRSMLRNMRLSDIGSCIFTLVNGGRLTVITSFDSVQRGVSIIPSLKTEVMYNDLMDGDLVYFSNVNEGLGSQRDQYEADLDFVRDRVESILNGIK